MLCKTKCLKKTSKHLKKRVRQGTNVSKATRHPLDCQESFKQPQEILHRLAEAPRETGKVSFIMSVTSHSHMANKNVIHRYKLLQTAVQSFSADEQNEF